MRVESNRIPFHRPHNAGRESQYLQDAVERGLGGGYYTQKCEAWLERELNATRVLLVPSCTAALEMAALICARGHRGTGDVLVPGYTFATSAAAFALHGFRPAFVDIDPDSGNIDEAQIARHITPDSRVIVPVHYAGIPAKIDAVVDLAREHDLLVVEDAAQALMSSYDGRAAGTFGDLAAVSFHYTKNISCGEGGALIVNSPDLVTLAEIIREKGTDRSRFLKGQVDRYTWHETSGSYVISELQSAFLLAQLEDAQQITEQRRHHFAAYVEGLRPLEAQNRIVLPKSCAAATGNAHLFFMLVANLDERDQFLAFMRQREVICTFHYTALHLTPNGAKWGPEKGGLPGVEAAADRLVRLPLYPGLTVEERDRVIKAVFDFFADG